MHGYAAAEGSRNKGRTTYTKAAEFTDLIFGKVTDASSKESGDVTCSFAAPITTAAMNVNTTVAARRTWSSSRSGGADAWAGGKGEEEGMGGAWVGGEATGLEQLRRVAERTGDHLRYFIGFPPALPT
ncbi:hypothetical protein MUK42_34657 [Musa troglodytarum]|uniref:Uncharacterized protein n=1 Tax=Musa troglodytarum TaxID=320322 RepID=A0A9E7E9F5_9LILI|nr:hypothetical protein MUK42_34657 [Musa troglodytarum]